MRQFESVGFMLKSEHAFLCPVSKQSCSFSFYPYCILHRTLLEDIHSCGDATLQLLDDHWTRLSLLFPTELIIALKQELEIAEHRQDIIDFLRVRTVIAMAEKKKIVLPIEILEKFKQLERIRKEKRQAAAANASETKKHNGSGKEEIIV